MLFDGNRLTKHNEDGYEGWLVNNNKPTHKREEMNKEWRRGNIPTLDGTTSGSWICIRCLYNKIEVINPALKRTSKMGLCDGNGGNNVRIRRSYMIYNNNLVVIVKGGMYVGGFTND